MRNSLGRRDNDARQADVASNFAANVDTLLIVSSCTTTFVATRLGRERNLNLSLVRSEGLYLRNRILNRRQTYGKFSLNHRSLRSYRTSRTDKDRNHQLVDSAKKPDLQL